MPAKRRQPSRARGTAPEERILDPDDARFIAAIHHYCNRWCERCEFSHRCYKFAITEDALGVGAATRESASQTVFDALSRIFAEAHDELEQTAQRAGATDEQKLAANVAVEKRLQRRALRLGARETKAAQTYARMVDEWFNNELQVPLRYVRSLEERVKSGLVRVAEAKGQLVRLNESVEVIRWHQHLIYVKLCRAFSSREEETDERGPKDSDGSAKTALIAIDGSVAAWGQICEMFTEKVDSILEMLVHLSRLRRAIEARFPRARKFLRAGFDEKPKRRPAARSKSKAKKLGPQP
jgi:hypothetical protein